MASMESGGFTRWTHYESHDNSGWAPNSQTIGHNVRAIDFWLNLNDAGRETVSGLTQSMPRDHFAGLLRVHARIWSNTKYIGLVFGLACGFLNVYTVVNGFVQFGNEVTYGRDSAITLRPGELQICSQTIRKTIASWTETNDMCKHDELRENIGCLNFSITHRFYAYRLLAYVEVFVVCSSALVSWTCLFLLLVCGCVNLPSRRPFFFVFLPRIASSFSSLWFLQFGNYARFESLINNMEIKFWIFLLADSFCPKRRPYDSSTVVVSDDLETARGSRTVSECDLDSLSSGHEEDSYWTRTMTREEGLIRDRTLSRVLECDTEAEGKRSDDHVVHMRWTVRCMAICIYVCLLLVSIQALVVKLTSMTFAVLNNVYHWTMEEWMLFIGGANQIVSVVPLYEIELHRVLLFAFGGSRVHWTWQRCENVAAWFSYLSKKVVEGKIGQKYGRLAIAATIKNLYSGDVQRLLLCPANEKNNLMVKSVRRSALEFIFATEDAVAFRDDLKAVNAKRLELVGEEEEDCESDGDRAAKIEELKRQLNGTIEKRVDVLTKMCDKLLIPTHAAINGLGIRRSSMLRLAADVHSVIEDLQELAEESQMLEDEEVVHTL